MGILALVSHVALHLVVEGAPDCLEVEHVEVHVNFIIFNKFYG